MCAACIVCKKKVPGTLFADLLTAEERGRIHGEEKEREKWQAVVADKDAELEQLRLQIAKLKENGDV